MDVHISLLGRTGLTDEIYGQLRAAILEGRLKSGQRLPPSRELARRLSVSRTTVTVAYERLVSEGYVDSRVGAGTYVSADLRPQPARVGGGPGALHPRPLWDAVPLPRAFARAAEYDFRAGIPDARLFPFDTWRRLQGRELRRSAVGKAAYAEPAGDGGLRAAIAQHVGVARGVRATGDDVVVTNGTQQAVDLVARVLLEPGEIVAVEDPGYPAPRLLIESLGLQVAPVPVDDEGMIVEAIPREARLVFVSPSHQFPLGVTMSLRRRLALLAWAEKHDAAVLEDDYDSEFRLSGRPIESLQMLDTSGRVIYVGTFSKTMLATLRIGFLVVPASLRHAARAAKFLADWHTALPTQRALARFIEEGWFARHVRRMRAVYRARHERIVEALGRDFADELEILPAAAGLHVSAYARGASIEQIDAAIERAAESGVAVRGLAEYGIRPGARPGLILGYGAIATEHVDEGLRRLRVALTASLARSA